MLVPVETILEPELDDVDEAWVLALGRAGDTPEPSCTSMRIEITPNVCDDSWYAIRLQSRRKIFFVSYG